MLLLYDITDDRIRHKVSEACKDYGLKREQYSAFSGQLNTNKREELFMRVKKLLGRHGGSIHLYNICEKDFRLRQTYKVEEPKEDD
ncbi:MAG: CRISPR-associated endoribonuclease Cas2 [Bacillota bacterium]|nr:MAG: CRISPR-associated endoribonuclease Cas2 [Bacillota bacterium]